MSPGNLIPTCAALVLTLAAVEGLAWWWMNPAPDAHGRLVLVYQPEQKTQSPESGIRIADGATRPDSPSPPQTANIPSSGLRHPEDPATASPSSSTPLPEIYRQAAPMLRCSGGEVFRVDADDGGLTLHLAWFEWDGTDTGSVLEAFRHMPEACMGSIGMKLVSREPPIRYHIKRRETAGGDPQSDAGDQGESHAAARKPSADRKPSIPPAAQTLLFDHAIFREPGQGGGLLGSGPLVHTFRAVWVAGVDAADARHGLDGTDTDRLRAIRLKSALGRFRPAHARVVQGAVRGAPNADAAWQAFEEYMLRDLRIE